MAWPQADALFHADPDWLGGDGAWSIDLGGGRALWLFGDSFIATSPARVRSQSVMVHTSIAVETGADPTAATMKFAWGGTAAAPASFFADPPGDWYWPAAGARLGAPVIVFLTHVTRSSGGGAFGFTNVGWNAALIADPDDPPAAWSVRYLDPPQNARSLFPGAAVLSSGGQLYAYAVGEPSHDLYLARWAADAAAAGDLSSPEWWCGAAGWVAERDFSTAPAAVVRGAQTELSVSSDGRGGFVMVHTVGFGAADLAYRTAPAVEGPWSEARAFYHPPEGAKPNAFVYAGKAHPELAGAPIVATYASNSFDFASLVNDPSLYYPRFVKFAPP
ncbi:MAG TPA: DUF4185 domain-containing protein [Polyangia bacterium]|nr:DUF4185 domain-containing protein [Polyangia bacterium]